MFDQIYFHNFQALVLILLQHSNTAGPPPVLSRKMNILCGLFQFSTRYIFIIPKQYIQLKKFMTYMLKDIDL